MEKVIDTNLKYLFLGDKIDADAQKKICIFYAPVMKMDFNYVRKGFSEIRGWR